MAALGNQKVHGASLAGGLLTLALNRRPEQGGKRLINSFVFECVSIFVCVRFCLHYGDQMDSKIITGTTE